MTFGRFRRGPSIYDRGEDRRLTMINFMREHGSEFDDVQCRRLVYENEEIDGWDHVQHLGEHMVRAYALKGVMTSDKS